MGAIVLGLDPGLAHLGYARVELTESGVHVLSLGVIATEKSDSKLRVLSADDKFRRAREMAAALAPLFVNVSVACAEAMSFPRNAKAANMLGYAWGCIAALCERHALPLVSASPQQIKVACTGSKSASKEEVQAALVRRFSDDLLSLAVSVKRADMEHCFDALGAVVACMSADVFQMARKIGVGNG